MDIKGRIAYITTEVAIDQSFHTYSGGLAVLSAAMGFAAHQKGIPFVDKNVREDSDALKELLALGYQSTPVTLIDGQAVIGFDQKRTEELLEI